MNQRTFFKDLIKTAKEVKLNSSTPPLVNDWTRRALIAENHIFRLVQLASQIITDENLSVDDDGEGATMAALATEEVTGGDEMPMVVSATAAVTNGAGEGEGSELEPGLSQLRSSISISRGNSIRRSNSHGSIPGRQRYMKPSGLVTTFESEKHLIHISKNLYNQSDQQEEEEEHRVVVQNPKALVHVDVEVPLQSKVQSYAIISISDLYDIEFFPRLHWNWAASFKSKPNDIFILSALKEYPLGGVFKVLKNSMSGFMEFTWELSESKAKTKMKKSTIEKKFTERWPDMHFVEIASSEASNDILQIEKTYTQAFPAMDITILQINPGQTDPLEMFLNKQHSPTFDKFLKIMDITLPLTEKTEFDWNDKKIRYFLASQMNEEQIRRLIGNTENVILFNDTNHPFDPIHIHHMGAVPQTFVVVQPLANKKMMYKIGSFHKFDKSFAPFVPTNYIFGAIDIKEFVLTKIYNGLMKSRTCPPYSVMYERPRLNGIREVVEKHVSSKGLAFLAHQKT